MRLTKPLLLASSLLCSSVFAAQAEVMVVTSIKPVHSLVSAVMEGVGEPGLIVDGAASPHIYALKPSQAKMLQEADVVFWIGHELEAFLEKPMEAIAGKAKSVELVDAHGLVKLDLREGGAFDEHGHDHDEEAKAGDDHDDHDHDKKAETDHDDHDHAKEAKAGDDHDDHDHGQFDAHIWLDPVNAKAMVHEIEEALIAANPGNAAKYEANAEALMAKIDILTKEIAAELEPAKGKGFILFHDAYQYFETRFGLTASGSITVSPEVMPGAERVSELRKKVQELGAVCIFAEPQFEPKLVATIAEGTKAKTGVLDPLGASIAEGPELYFTLIRDMATSFKTCLLEAS